MIFCSRETVELLLLFHSATKHLKIGFKELNICLIFAIPYIFLTIVDLILGIFRKNKII